MIYDTSKIFVNNVGRMFNQFKRCALFAVSNLTTLFISSLEAGGKSKLKESGERFSFMVATPGWFL